MSQIYFKFYLGQYIVVETSSASQNEPISI